MLVTALFTLARGKSLANVSVHIDLQNPVTDLVSLLRINEILFGQCDIIGRRNISVLELSVVRNAIVVWVLDGVVQVDVAVEENKCHIVVLVSFVRHASIIEGLV